MNIEFTSPKPMSNNVPIRIRDDFGNLYDIFKQNFEQFSVFLSSTIFRFEYNVVATADNSIFTCYGFLAEHQTEYHIVLEEVISP